MSFFAAAATTSIIITLIIMHKDKTASQKAAMRSSIENKMDGEIDNKVVTAAAVYKDNNN